MSGYILESGGIIEQNRYLELQKRLRKEGYDGRRGFPDVLDRRENPDLCESQILDMFWDAAPIAGPKIYEQMTFLGHRQKTSRQALKSLRDKGILCLHERKYRLMETNAEPLELGAPIVFLPGTKSQTIGYIAEIKELKSGPGGTYPIAVLSNGMTMFVSPATAKVDMSQKILEDYFDWLSSVLRTAVNRETAVPASVICLKALQDGIPQASNLIKAAAKLGKISRGYKRLQRFSECIYWKNL